MMCFNINMSSDMLYHKFQLKVLIVGYHCMHIELFFLVNCRRDELVWKKHNCNLLLATKCTKCICQAHISYTVYWDYCIKKWSIKAVSKMLFFCRRLFAWLLGSEVNISLLSSEHPLVKKSKSSEGSSSNLYFDMYSREMLIQVCNVHKCHYCSVKRFVFLNWDWALLHCVSQKSVSCIFKRIM